MLDSPSHADSDSSITSLNGHAGEIEVVRRTGLASDHEQTLVGVCCLAAPVRDAMGRTVAAVGAVVPTVRFDGHDATLGKATIAAASRIGNRLASA
jgi:DNA-binding IclR family transcriptional regulator